MPGNSSRRQNAGRKIVALKIQVLIFIFIITNKVIPVQEMQENTMN
jgi:hypothetical protein